MRELRSYRVRDFLQRLQFLDSLRESVDPSQYHMRSLLDLPQLPWASTLECSRLTRPQFQPACQVSEEPCIAVLKEENPFFWGNLSVIKINFGGNTKYKIVVFCLDDSCSVLKTWTSLSRWFCGGRLLCVLLDVLQHPWPLVSWPLPIAQDYFNPFYTELLG